MTNSTGDQEPQAHTAGAPPMSPYSVDDSPLSHDETQAFPEMSDEEKQRILAEHPVHAANNEEATNVDDGVSEADAAMLGASLNVPPKVEVKSASPEALMEIEKEIRDSGSKGTLQFIVEENESTLSPHQALISTVRYEFFGRAFDMLEAGTKDPAAWEQALQLMEQGMTVLEALPLEPK